MRPWAISQADILIEDGKIRAVGPSLEAADAEAIDGAGMIALPGIIDAHTCLWQTVLRGYVPDLWPGTYYSKLLPLRSRYTPEDNFNAAYVGGFEMLSYGTTTVVDYCHDIRSPAYAPASIAALKETGIRHLFTYSFMPVQPDEFPRPEDRLADGRRVYDKFHDPAGLTTIGFGVDSIGAPGSRKAARLCARAEGAELHSRERDRHHRPAECRRPARTGSSGDPRQPDHQRRARADGQGPHAALLHPDRRHAGHAGRCRSPRHRSRRRGRVRLRRSLFHRVRSDRAIARHVQRPGLSRRGDGAELLDRRRTAAAGPARPAAADAAQAARDRDHRNGARAGPRRPDRFSRRPASGPTSC